MASRPYFLSAYDLVGHGSFQESSVFHDLHPSKREAMLTVMRNIALDSGDPFKPSMQFLRDVLASAEDTSLALQVDQVVILNLFPNQDLPVTGKLKCSFDYPENFQIALMPETMDVKKSIVNGDILLSSIFTKLALARKDKQSPEEKQLFAPSPISSDAFVPVVAFDLFFNVVIGSSATKSQIEALSLYASDHELCAGLHKFTFSLVFLTMAIQAYKVELIEIGFELA